MSRTGEFASFGLDSLALFSLTGELAEWLGRDLPALLIWEHPTIETLARHLAASTDGWTQAPPPRASREAPLPLSFSQERLYRYANHGEGGDRNLFVGRWRLKGPLDVTALRGSLEAVIGRHEILRTTFVTIGGAARQIVHPPGPVPFSVVDCSEAAEPERDASRALEEVFRQPMHLARGPLIRVLLIRLSADDHRLVIGLHHLLYDAASLAVFHDELSAHYAAFRYGGAPPAIEEPLQVADFAAWQREHLRSDQPHYQTLLNWWLHYWAPPLPRPLALPFRRPRRQRPAPPEPSVVSWVVPPRLADAIQRVAQTAETTHFTVLLAAFEVLLFQFTRQDRFVIGTYVSDRSRAVSSRSMGFFINLLALRADLSGRPSFADVVGRVRDMWRDASRHRELPFEALATEMKNAARTVPRVDIIFQQVRTAPPLVLAELEVGRWVTPPAPQRLWGLSIGVQEYPDRLQIDAGFDVTIYERAAIIDVLRQYDLLLRVMTTDPHSPVGQTIYRARAADALVSPAP